MVPLSEEVKKYTSEEVRKMEKKYSRVFSFIALMVLGLFCHGSRAASFPNCWTKCVDACAGTNFWKYVACGDFCFIECVLNRSSCTSNCARSLCYKGIIGSNGNPFEDEGEKCMHQCEATCKLIRGK